MTQQKKQRLTSRQEQFCREYIIDLNATQAAIRAGYSEKTAKEMGYENLTKPHIQEKIAEFKQASISRVRNERELEITADRVLEEVTALAFGNIGDFLTIGPGNHVKLNIEGLKSDKTRALKDIQVTERFSMMPTAEGLYAPCKIIQFKLTLWDKVAALNMLMKHLGLFNTHHKSSVSSDLIQRLQDGRERVRQRSESDQSVTTIVELLKKKP